MPVTVSNRRTTAVSLAAGDTLDVTAAGSVTVFAGVGVIASGQNSLNFNGEIIAPADDALFLGAGVNNVVIGATGSLYGTRGLFASGGSNNLVNAGQIFGTTSAGVQLTGGQNYVLNSGVVFSKFDALGIGGVGNIIENSGLLQSQSGAAVTLVKNGNTITNSGLMDGLVGIIVADASTAGTNQIVNFGTIRGRTDIGIATGNGADIVVNLGVISGVGPGGGVSLAGGDDVLDNGGGTITGAIDMGEGDDRVVSGVGAETINGGNGRDTISYIVSAQAVIIDLGAQMTFDGFVSDTLSSFENAIGSNFNDTLFGSNSRDDVLDGGRAGADKLFAGDGNDTASWATSLVGVVIDLTAQAASDGDQLASIENATGSAFADTIFGNGLANIIDGGAGGADVMHGLGGLDTISYMSATAGRIIDLGVQAANDGDTFSGFENARGSTFNDQIFGDGGDNTFFFSGGADIYQGNGGTDTLNYAGRSTGIIVDLGAGASSSGDAFTSIENATGTDFNDIFFGSEAPNRILGGLGADTLNGFGGNDILVGGRGDDTMNGGAGNDRFLVSETSNSVLIENQSGFDTINGFEKVAGGGGDRLDLTDASPTASWEVIEAGGNTLFRFIDGGVSVIASVTVVGVTGMVAGDDYNIFI